MLYAEELRQMDRGSLIDLRRYVETLAEGISRRCAAALDAGDVNAGQKAAQAEHSFDIQLKLIRNALKEKPFRRKKAEANPELFSGTLIATQIALADASCARQTNAVVYLPRNRNHALKME